jgi:Tfp pilus assembly protein PilO
VKARLETLSPRALLGIAAGVVLVWTLLLWLLYVSPHRSGASDAKADLAAAQAELLQAQVASHRPSAVGGTTASDVLRLAEAMPASGELSGLVFELSRLAKASNVQLRSITSSPVADGPGGTRVVPVTVTVGGRFRQITRFLQRTRALVSLRRGRVDARGRLLSVESVELAESLAGGFPNLDATIILDAFAYDGPIAPATPPGGSEGTTTDTTSTSSSAASGGTGS